MQPPTGRLYVCARCRAQVIVCRRCDRGQIYCGRDCSLASRRASQREAGRRYQRSRRGRSAHAARMRRFRDKRNKVTHHGSTGPAADALLASTSTTSASGPIPPRLLLRRWRPGIAVSAAAHANSCVMGRYAVGSSMKFVLLRI